jgi:trimethylamine monooxygenase
VPKEIEQRLLPERIDKHIVTFKDGSSASVDVIIFCTVYIYHYPFLRGNLRFDIEGQKSNLYPAGLYKGTVCIKGGNNKLFHINQNNLMKISYTSLKRDLNLNKDTI